MDVNDSNLRRTPLPRDDDALEFLPAALEVMESPPKPLGRILAIMIGLMFMIAIFWAAFSPIDIVAVADGRVVPNGQIKVIQSAQSGVVSEILVAEGDRVQSGALLVRLDPTEATTNRERLELELARAELDQAVALALLGDDPMSHFVVPPNVDDRLVELSTGLIVERWRNYLSLLEENESEQDRISSALSALQKDQEAFGATVSEFEDLYSTATQLDEAGLSTKSELASVRLQLISSQNQLQNASHAISQAKLQLVAIAAQRLQIVSGFQREINLQLAEARQSILLARRELDRLRLRETHYELRAPVAGTVHEVTVHTIGAVVSPSERILSIVPEGVTMEIEAALENKDVGFIEVGQSAEIKLEAFPFTRFGVVGATVTHISPDAVMDESRGPLFTIRLTPSTSSLIPATSPIRLSPGMRATAEIKTGKRTVLEFFLTPLLRYRDEAIRER